MTQIDSDPGPRDPVLWQQYTNTHGLQKSCGEKGAVQLLSKLERVPQDPRLDRLLLFFWAHYIEDGPHLLRIGLFWVVIFCRQRKGCC